MVNKCRRFLGRFLELEASVINTQSIERCILLYCLNSYARHDLASKFFRTGVAVSFFAAIAITVGFVMLDDIRLLYVFIVVLLAPLISIIAIKRFHLKVKHINEGKNMHVRRGDIRVGAAAGFLGIVLQRWLSFSHPGLILSIFAYLIIALGMISIFSLSSFFYTAYLIKNYCPYLVTPEDRKYNRDIHIGQ